MAKTNPKVLIVEARFYEDIADELVAGAVEVLVNADVDYDRISVPGVLEIPAAVSMALINSDEMGENGYSGFITLGCVIRGETSHYDIVANESARALMDMASTDGLALGNGILTVENAEQAWARAKRDQKNKGAAAAQATLIMMDLREKFGLA